MRLHSKGGVRVITIDKAEQRQLRGALDTLIEIEALDPNCKCTADITAVVDRINQDGRYTPAVPQQSNEPAE